MPSDWNPYESPLAQDVETPIPRPSADVVWRDGNLLVCRRVIPISIDHNSPSQSAALIKAAKLPDRCFKCNAPANGRILGGVLSWHHPALYLLNLLTPFVYLQFARAWTQSAAVQFGLCKRHWLRQRILGGACYILLLLGLGLTLYFPYLPKHRVLPALITAASMIIVSSICGGVVKARFASIKQLNRNLVWIKGANKDYLAELPDFSTREP